MGVRGAVVTSMRPDALCAALAGWFDRVLVDAPCSGEGMLRREAAAAENWSEQNVKACALRQAKILDSAADALRPGGTLCYSTCTFAPEEDEGTVSAFLARHPDFYLTEPPGELDLPGRPELGGGLTALTKTRRIFPRMGGEGHFVALFRRRDTAVCPPAAIPSPVKARRKGKEPDKPAEGLSQAEAVKRFLSFWEENLEGEPEGAPVLRSGRLYLLPPGLPSLDGLHVLRAGLYCGDFTKGRFVPAHALFAAVSWTLPRPTPALLITSGARNWKPGT